MALARLMLDPRVAAPLCPPNEPLTEAAVRSGLDRNVEHWRRHGFGLWALRERATREFVGRGGPQYTDAIGPPAVEVGARARAVPASSARQVRRARSTQKGPA